MQNFNNVRGGAEVKEECGDIKNMIFEYLSGELTEEEVKIFEKHILTCDECRAELDFSKELDGFLDNIACEPPEELKGRVISTVKRDRRLKLFYRISKAALPAAAMIAIIFLLCGYPRTAKMNSPAEDEGTILEDNYCDAEMLKMSLSAETNILIFGFSLPRKAFFLGARRKYPTVMFQIKRRPAMRHLQIPMKRFPKMKISPHRRQSLPKQVRRRRNLRQI